MSFWVSTTGSLPFLRGGGWGIVLIDGERLTDARLIFLREEGKVLLFAGLALGVGLSLSLLEMIMGLERWLRRSIFATRSDPSSTSMGSISAVMVGAWVERGVRSPADVDCLVSCLLLEPDMSMNDENIKIKSPLCLNNTVIVVLSIRRHIHSLLCLTTTEKRKKNYMTKIWESH